MSYFLCCIMACDSLGNLPVSSTLEWWMRGSFGCQSMGGFSGLELVHTVHINVNVYHIFSERLPSRGIAAYGFVCNFRISNTGKKNINALIWIVLPENFMRNLPSALSVLDIARISEIKAKTIQICMYVELQLVGCVFRLCVAGKQRNSSSSA